MFFFQLTFAESAVSYSNFAFIDRLVQDWSPGWQYPAGEMVMLKDTLRQPGVLKAALSYYRHSLNPTLQSPALAAIRVQMSEPVPVPALYIHGAKDGCMGVEVTTGMERMFAKGVDKRVIENAGHFVHQERPEIVNSLILEYLKH
jgi:pimeloyl-ACP methyl ester carboxylesterase